MITCFGWARNPDPAKSVASLVLGLSVFLRVEEAHETVRHDGKEYRVVNAPADVEVKKTTLVTRSCQLTPQRRGPWWTRFDADALYRDGATSRFNNVSSPTDSKHDEESGNGSG